MPHSEYIEYIVFVDESGDHGLTSIDSGYPVFVLCFCIFSKAHYSNKVVPKLKAIKFQTFGHDLVILHESDIRNKRGRLINPCILFANLGGPKKIKNLSWNSDGFAQE
jgi:hypothetical protein